MIGVVCNAKETAMLCSMCSATEDGCHEDCDYDNGINICYKRGKSLIILWWFALIKFLLWVLKSILWLERN